MSRAYYNELNEEAAETLRELIKAGHIAAGDVDERSIEDVQPDDLRGYTQCHFFAGIGVWSAALRLAGWPDDRPVWTGSCPCQPFSQAGKGDGLTDERHLWPAWQWLIAECRPAVIFGEQVASKDAEPWLDLVSSDMEGLGYAFGALAFPSAGVGAPHIRDRTYFVAHANHARPQGRKRVQQRAVELFVGTSGLAGIVADASRERQQGKRLRNGTREALLETAGRGKAGIVADAERGPAERQRLDVGSEASGVRSSSRQQRVRDDAGHGGNTVELADAEGDGYERAGKLSEPPGRHGASHCGSTDNERPGPTNGFWRDADWLLCRDEKWRPVEPGSFPLVDGAPARVGRLRGYGNAINRYAAATFIEAAREAIEGMTL